MVTKVELLQEVISLWMRIDMAGYESRRIEWHLAASKVGMVA
jgi:hypothetical protein